MNSRVQSDFFQQDALTIAPLLLGNYLARHIQGKTETYMINEVEVYKGEEDKACHASKGMTNRNAVMYQPGGLLYVYLIYGMYWMLNIVTGQKDDPQALLIRGIKGFDGPGKLTKKLVIDKSFNGEDLEKSNRIWVEYNQERPVNFITKPRVRIDYAGEYWANIPWRYILT
jgi:DNA-3-methyladenine glycosylase